MLKASKDIAYGLALSLGLMLVAIVIRPKSLDANDGLSYLGNHLDTIGPYSLAFLLNAIFYLKASYDIRLHPIKKYLSIALRIIAILMLGIVMIPDSKLYSLHTTLGTLLFLSQFILSIYITALRPKPLALLLFLFEFAAGLTSLYFLVTPNGLLLQAQIFYQIGFSLVLIYSLNSYNKKPKK